MSLLYNWTSLPPPIYQITYEYIYSGNAFIYQITEILQIHFSDLRFKAYLAFIDSLSAVPVKMYFT